ncbi:hypothetical protein V6N13_129199 [Hibiscus sabdariffa]
MEGIACASCFDEEALKVLLDAFGSKFSLDDIASAYYEAKGDVNVTGDILCAKNHGSSVAGVIGENYVKQRSSRTDCSDTTKPVKIDSKDLPMSAIWSEEDPSSRTTRNDTTHGDLEKFLFQMLGDGFQLDKSVIQEVLVCCGFDVDKSMDKLLDMSASTLEKSDDVIGIAAEKLTGRCLENQSFLIRGKPQSKVLSQSEEAASMIRNPKRSPRVNKDKVAQEKEILETLFTVAERSEEGPKINRVARRSMALGELVTKPLEDTDIILTRNVVEMLKIPKDVEDEQDDDENSYDALRQAVKEYWMTMKEYYKAAAEAYAEGDQARATKLMELGHFFHRKAREADERSSAKMLESSCADDEIMSLDLRDFKPKEAVNLLRIHLTTVSGIPSIMYLRIIVGTIEEDTKKGARRRLIMKLLEKESIKWKVEEDGRVILIRVDVINPKNLRFGKKKSENMGSF